MSDKNHHTIPGFMKTTIILSLLSCLCIFFWSTHVSAAADWYKYGPVIHACGRYHGYAYTNSKEALKNTLKAKRNLRKVPIEVDFMLTSDGFPVCVHDWESYNRNNGIRSGKRMSLKKFKKSHTKGGFTPMTAWNALGILGKYKNAYLVIDTKEENIDIYRKLVVACKETGYRDLLNRFIIQLYHFEDYKKIKKIYPFKHWLFTAYKVGCNTPGQIRTIVKKTQKLKLDALVMPYTSFLRYRNHRYSFKYKNLRAVNKKRRVPLICHTINSNIIARALYRNKFNGIYTDRVR